MNKKTAMQQHIEWLEATIEIAEQQAPVLVNALNLCLNDAKQKLQMEKEQEQRAYKRGQKHKKPLKDSNPITKYLKSE
jgi:hypothetical protein